MTPWTAHYYTHPSSYYLPEPSAAGQLVSVEIPKPVGERLSRNEEAEMRLWAKRFGKCVRQRAEGSAMYDKTIPWTELVDSL